VIIETINQIEPSQQKRSQDRGVLFGDGFFTTGIIEAGRVKHLALHLNRLEESVAHFNFDGFNASELNAEISTIAARIAQATFRITVSRVQSPRGYQVSPDQSCKISILLTPWLAAPAQHCHAFFAQTPISVNPALAGFKHLNRLDSVLAASECQSAEQEAIMTAGEQVICGSKSNLFVYHQQSWITPRLDQAGIRGLTRHRLIEAARLAGINIVEGTVTKNMLESCQAAFLTNSILGIWPISHIGNISLDTQICHDLQSQLNFLR